MKRVRRTARRVRPRRPRDVSASRGRLQTGPPTLTRCQRRGQMQLLALILQDLPTCRQVQNRPWGPLRTTAEMKEVREAWNPCPGDPGAARRRRSAGCRPISRQGSDLRTRCSSVRGSSTILPHTDDIFQELEQRTVPKNAGGGRA